MSVNGDIAVFYHYSFVGKFCENFKYIHNFFLAHRALKKRTFRSLWITRINAAVRAQGMTYSQFIGKLNAKGIVLNRKVMADLAMNEPKAFEAIVKAVK